jgi:predicted MPP superfamily phosphohydrolase
LHDFLDYSSLAVFLVTQWFMARALLAAAAARLSPAACRMLRRGLWVAAAALGVALILSWSQRYVNLGRLSRPVSVMGAVVISWLVLSTATYLLYWFFRQVSQRLSPPAFHPSRRHLMNVAGGALVASPMLVLGYGSLVQRTDFQVRERDLALPGLPQDLDGLRLLQISDIHLSVFLSENEFARVIDAANETRAHVALVTGDLISSSGDPLDACLRQLARLRTDAGTFGCLGNHERYAFAEQHATDQGARLGIRFLRQQAAPLRFGGSVLNVAGVDYQEFRRRRHYLRGAERLVAPGALNVLLSHNPDVFPVAARQGYHLMLAGHTHGGQVTVEILDQSINPARFFTPYVYGMYSQGAARAYVTRGIGTIGIPVRLGAPPEITVLRLRKA